MDDPKIFRKKKLAQTILNGPIRKVIMVKVKFEDLRFFYYQVNQIRHLKNKKKVSKWSYLKKTLMVIPGCHRSRIVTTCYISSGWQENAKKNPKNT